MQPTHNTEGSTEAQNASGPPRQSRARRLLLVLCGLLAIYLLGAYVIAPRIWHREIKKHPGMADAPRITHTANGIPGDPLNIALVGSESDLIHAMTAAGWFPADAITFGTSVRIAVDSVFRKPDDQAPVSDLYLFGRKQDLAFEQPVGDSPRQRHHVRFWLWDKTQDGRPVWFGSATFDERVGLSYTTGQVTHHIGPDVDAERDRIMSQLRATGGEEKESWLDGFHQELQGKNGGGDPWHTDGRLGIVVLVPYVAAPGPITNKPPNP